MSRSVIATLGFSALLATACAPRVQPETPTPTATTRISISDRLYFGRDIPGGGNVTEDDWSTFLADVVTPRFPSGLTAWRAQGQWRDSTGTIVREESFVLELIHPDDQTSEALVREIMAEYKRRFRQEAVLRVRNRVEMSVAASAVTRTSNRSS